MRRRADLLLAAGLLAALALPAAGVCQVTYQQSSVNNQQSQIGDVLATGTLNVVTVDDATSTVTAMANGYSADVESGSLDVVSEQWAPDNVRANNTVTVGSYAGVVNMTTAATGNTGDANSLGFGDMTADIDQAVGNSEITANATLNGSGAYIGSANVNAQAVANSHGFSMVGGASEVAIEQSSGAVSQAEAEGEFRYTDGSVIFSAAAMSNNVTIGGTEGADQTYAINQSMYGDRTQASVLVAAANAQELTGTATAIANNVTAANQYNPFDITVSQENNGYVRAESDVYAYDFGSGSANAYGVGNSVVAGNQAIDMTMDVEQTNTGAVQTFAKFEGNGPYDAYGSSVAMGNASTGYACSTCASVLDVRNRQANSNLVTASSSITLTGEARSAIGVATAVGNSATYYISRPGS